MGSRAWNVVCCMERESGRRPSGVHALVKVRVWVQHSPVDDNPGVGALSDTTADMGSCKKGYRVGHHLGYQGYGIRLPRSVIVQRTFFGICSTVVSRVRLVEGAPRISLSSATRKIWSHGLQLQRLRQWCPWQDFADSCVEKGSRKDLEKRAREMLQEKKASKKCPLEMVAPGCNPRCSVLAFNAPGCTVTFFQSFVTYFQLRIQKLTGISFHF